MRNKSSGTEHAPEGVQPPQRPDQTHATGTRTTKAKAGSGSAKSLIKTSAFGAKSHLSRPAGSSAIALATGRDKSKPKRYSIPAGANGGRHQKIQERMGAATEQLTSGITEAAAAAEQLRRAMEQISTGAEEAASAAQQTLATATSTATTLTLARDRAEAVRRRTEALQGLLVESATQIGAWASNIR